MTAQIVKSHACDYPLISGVCRRLPDELVASSVASDGGTISAEPAVTPRPTLLAGVADGTRLVFRKTTSGYQMVKGGIESAAGSTVDFLRRSASLVLPGI